MIILVNQSHTAHLRRMSVCLFVHLPYVQTSQNFVYMLAVTRFSDDSAIPCGWHHVFTLWAIWCVSSGRIM